MYIYTYAMAFTMQIYLERSNLFVVYIAVFIIVDLRIHITIIFLKASIFYRLIHEMPTLVNNYVPRRKDQRSISYIYIFRINIQY